MELCAYGKGSCTKVVTLLSLEIFKNQGGCCETIFVSDGRLIMSSWGSELPFLWVLLYLHLQFQRFSNFRAWRPCLISPYFSHRTLHSICPWQVASVQLAVCIEVPVSLEYRMESNLSQLAFSFSLLFLFACLSIYLIIYLQEE